MAIHPSSCQVINEVFSIEPELLEYYRELVEKFEEAMKEGKAAISLKGRMIDVPGYKRAKAALEKHTE